MRINHKLYFKVQKKNCRLYCSRRPRNHFVAFRQNMPLSYCVIRNRFVTIKNLELKCYVTLMGSLILIQGGWGWNLWKTGCASTLKPREWVRKTSVFITWGSTGAPLEGCKGKFWPLNIGTKLNCTLSTIVWKHISSENLTHQFESLTEPLRGH